MFARWGSFVARRRWAVLLVSVLVFASVAPFAVGATNRLTAGGWIGSGTEAFAVDQALSQTFGRTGANHDVLFRDPSGDLLATDPAFIAAVDAAIAPIRDDPTIASILTYGSTGNTAVDALLFAADARSSLVAISLNVSVAEATEAFDAFRARVQSDRLEIIAGGWPAASRAFTDLADLAEEDLTPSELITLPMTLILLVVVFGAFASSRVLLVQSLGVGLALAVLLDATLVRALLVPATMRLLGDWNWWSPAWTRRGRRESGS